VTKYVRFVVGSDHYAVVADRVLKVSSARDVVTMPSPAPRVAGLIQFEAQILTVVNAFGRGGAHVLIIDGGGRGSRPFGVQVEQVTDVVDVDPAGISDRPAGQQDNSISGVIANAQGMTMVVDLDASRGWRPHER
jgi:chemotaxis signal transduction protein